MSINSILAVSAILSVTSSANVTAMLISILGGK